MRAGLAAGGTTGDEVHVGRARRPGARAARVGVDPAAGRGSWLRRSVHSVAACLALVVLGAWHGVAASGYLADLEQILADASGRSGLTLRLDVGPCVGIERIDLHRSWCVRHAVAADAARWGTELALRQQVATDALARALEASPRRVAVTRYPASEIGEPWVNYVLEYPEGLLDVSVTPLRAYQATATFRPRDPIGPCLRVNAQPVDLFELAGAYERFGEDHARTVLACTPGVGVSDASGRTPLFEAVAAGDAAAVRAFLASGWRPDHRAEGGWTPLLLATRDGREPAVVTALLAAGADPTLAPDEARWRDALWYARRNDQLAGSEALVALIAAYVLRAALPPAPTTPVRVVAEGTAPYLPPSVAPTAVEVVLLEGTVSLRGDVTVLVEVGPTRERSREGLQLELALEIVQWTLPLVLDGHPYVAAVTYVQRIEASEPGASDQFDDLIRDASDDVWFEIVDVRDGTWGATRFAIADDIGDAASAAALGLVPLRGLLVGAGLRTSGDVRLGTGATWTVEQVVPLDGGALTIVQSDRIAEVAAHGFTVESRESVAVPGLVQHAWGIETVTSLHQETTYQARVRPHERVRALVDGAMDVAQTVVLVDGGERLEIEVSASGTLSANARVVDWTALTPENQRGVIRRIARLLLERL